MGDQPKGCSPPWPCTLIRQPGWSRHVLSQSGRAPQGPLQPPEKQVPSSCQRPTRPRTPDGPLLHTPSRGKKGGKGQPYLWTCRIGSSPPSPHYTPWRIARARFEEQWSGGAEPPPIRPQTKETEPERSRQPLPYPPASAVACNSPPLPCRCTCHTEIEF